VFCPCCLQGDTPDKQESGGGTSVEDETRMVAKDGITVIKRASWRISSISRSVP
jgi:hypothetical protein